MLKRILAGTDSYLVRVQLPLLDSFEAEHNWNQWNIISLNVRVLLLPMSNIEILCCRFSLIQRYTAMTSRLLYQL